MPTEQELEPGLSASITETVTQALAGVVRQDKLRRLTEMVFDVDNDEIEAWSGPELDSEAPPPLP